MKQLFNEISQGASATVSLLLYFDMDTFPNLVIGLFQDGEPVVQFHLNDVDYTYQQNKLTFILPPSQTARFHPGRFALRIHAVDGTGYVSITEEATGEVLANNFRREELV